MTTTFDDTPATSGAVPARAAAGRRPIDLLMLAAVGLVVCLVSLPRLHGYVLGTNEVDARRAVELFGAALCGADVAPPLDLGAALAADRTLKHRLRDARPAPDGSRVLFHGYYFELGRALDGGPLVYGWPCEQGRTGLGAFAMGADGQLFGHENGNGRWSGDDAPRELDLRGPGWLRLASPPR